MGKVRVAGTVFPVAWLVGLALVIGALATVEIWRSYHLATVAAERAVVGLATLLAEQTERTIQAIDLTLIGMRDALRVAPGMPRFDAAYGAALRERLKSLPYVRALHVIGPDGFIMQNSGNPWPDTSLADRPYFQAHQTDPELGLHIGQPLRSLSEGVWFVSFSRRIVNADGSFGGVVLAAVEPSYFKRFYKGLSLAEDDLIALLLKDGTLLVCMPDHEGTIGKSLADSPALQAAIAHGSGVLWSTSPIDARHRFLGYRTLAGGSLVVLAGQSEHTVYDAWFDHAVIVGGGSILVWLLAAGLASVWFMYRRREQLEQAHLAQVQRLEMMGRIAGGVAHDLGNTVKVARTTFTLLKPHLADRLEAITLVEDADRSLRSAFDIIDRLLAFARRKEMSPRSTDVGELIDGFAPILRQAAGPAIEVGLDVGRGLVCSVDPIHLESALLNLVLNSKDATPDGGRIVIELRESRDPGARKPRRGRPPPVPRWAEIVVRDNGSGMSREVLDRAFEPFFTTRTGGSGLGLSQVLGFVQQSAGAVRIESTEGAGTTVILLFPTTSEPAGSPSSPVLSPPAGGWAGGS
jgi:two-component system, NtrC family, sensor kinase